MTVAGVVIFGSICDMLLPEGTFRKYMRLAIGLILILTMVNPIQQLLHNPLSLPSFSYENQAAYRQHEEMEEMQQKEIMTVYKKRLEEKIMTSVRAMFGNCQGYANCRIETDDERRFGTIQAVTIVLKQDEKIGTENEIKAFLHENYGIKKESITVSYTRENLK